MFFLARHIDSTAFVCKLLITVLFILYAMRYVIVYYYYENRTHGTQIKRKEKKKKEKSTQIKTDKKERKNVSTNY